MSKAPWWKDGVRFECQGSGKCCVSRGEFGYVYLTKEDRVRMAQVLSAKLKKKVSTIQFMRQYCAKTDGVWHLKETENPECIMLEGGNRCGVYEGRPVQCRTWPFWPEVMGAKAWKNEVAAYCPGVGKGKLHSGEEIARTIKEQSAWENDLARGK
ncbi:MAG TPA: YkgJ family cysteine cluster protein [Bdellovibrionales bacterium]|nr:YkgJ family cysteine cluster protein [Bdellovibrionales bacterium]